MTRTHQAFMIIVLAMLLLPTTISAETSDKSEDQSGEVDNIETIYVTDTLHLKLYEEAGGKGATLKTLSSGNALKVLDTKGRYIKVETVDGVVGWVKKFYTVSKPPAAVALPEIQRLLDERDAEVAKLQKQLEQKQCPDSSSADSSASQCTNLEDKLIKLNAENVELLNEKERLRKQLQQFELAQLHGETPPPIVGSTGSVEKPLHPAVIAAIAAATGFLLGTILGYRLYASRLRKRFYGHKI